MIVIIIMLVIVLCELCYCLLQWLQLDSGLAKVSHPCIASSYFINSYSLMGWSAMYIYNKFNNKIVRKFYSYHNLDDLREGGKVGLTLNKNVD